MVMEKKDQIRDLLDEVWPAERDVLFRPHRLKYVRKIIQPKGCVFCEAAKAKNPLEKLVLYKSKHAMVVLNKYPYNSGHVLILPVRHCAEIEKLTPAEAEEIHALIPKTVAILKKEYDCSGLNIGLNLGAAAGAGIPDHLHYHVIPRWAGDTNFFPLIAETKMAVETLETTMDKLVKAFSKLKGKKK